ncbi:MAG TPA: CHRD domain-containing protein [Vicinamibacterales bacterium]|nr:CHRD domain-containing protein [Vicinamibacterales bacterium]
MTRVTALILGLSILAVGCGSDSSPAGPSQGTTTTSTFTVPLSPSNEVPAIANADASGSGTVVIALTVTKDGAGTITSASANFQISVAGFPAATRVTDAHIHSAAAGSNGSAIINVGLTSGELAITNGSGSISKNGINVPADRAAAILNNRAGFYFNVHTGLNPDGAIRGQLSEGAFDPGTTIPY